MSSGRLTPIEKLPTWVPGLDQVCRGGLPRGRATLVTGCPGAGKTSLAAHFLAAGIARDAESAVFVAIEERADDVRRHLAGFGWDVPAWEREGLWTFVDVLGDDGPAPGAPAELEALLARIETAVRTHGASRVAVDGIDALFEARTDRRFELRRLLDVATADGATAVVTCASPKAYGDAAAGWPAFVADNVVDLRLGSAAEGHRRTLRIVKLRGTDHASGESSFTIVAGRGVEILPRPTLESPARSSEIRVTSGNVQLDRMCGGGFFRDSVVYVSGPTGTGKTLMTTEFLSGGARLGERCLLVSFEENREQLRRNAAGWSVDTEQLVSDERLRIVCSHPDERSVEDHLVGIEREIAAFEPNRMAIDGVSALERSVSRRGFDDFASRLTSLARRREIATLLTTTTPSLLGGATSTEAHLATLADVVILLAYVEIFGEVRRGLTVLKQRGSTHHKDICEIGIDGSGMSIGRPFRHTMGILAGQASYVPAGELERLQRLPSDGDDPF